MQREHWQHALPIGTDAGIFIFARWKSRICVVPPAIAAETNCE
jgi:hypothetical protein